MPSDDPLANGRQLNQALIVAVQPGREHENYFARHRLQGDGGYLHALKMPVRRRSARYRRARLCRSSWCAYRVGSSTTKASTTAMPMAHTTRS